MPDVKAAARVALVGVDPASAAILAESFRAFGIDCVPLGEDAITRFAREKFEGCVVPLDGQAEPLLQAVRASPSNRRVILYGLASGVRDALRFSTYGINAVFDLPLEKAAALRIVRATHLLVVHELRRYVRIPFVTAVRIESSGKWLTGASLEISAGGLSLSLSEALEPSGSVGIAFDLPHDRKVEVGAQVAWVRQALQQTGLRFNTDDHRRFKVREWIDEYLDSY